MAHRPDLAADYFVNRVLLESMHAFICVLSGGLLAAPAELHMPPVFTVWSFTEHVGYRCPNSPRSSFRDD